MSDPNFSPTLTLCRDPKSRYHQVRVKWAGDSKRPRLSLGVLLEHDPATALEAFRRDVLPALCEERAERLAEEGRRDAEARRPEHLKAGPKLRDLADWFLDTHLLYERRSAKTSDHYRRQIDRFINFCSSRHVSRAGQLSTRIVQEWQIEAATDRGRSGPSRDEVLAVKHWLDTCVEHGELRERIAGAWSVPPKTKSRRFKAYSREVVTPWLEAMKPWRGGRLWQVCAWVDCTGWRIGDALDLRVGEVDFTNGEIHRHQLKTNGNLSWPLTAHHESILRGALAGRDCPESDEHVFLDKKGRPWEYFRLMKQLEYFQRGGEEAPWNGVKLTFRDLRKTFGTQLAMAGCPPNVLKELMGHSSIELTLSFYVDVDLDSMRQWVKKKITGDESRVDKPSI